MDTELLKTFLEVSRTRHFGRAAEALYLTQSAVSFRIRQLENQLGVNLFTRHRNNIRLTTAGEKLLPYAETLMVLMYRSKATQKLNNIAYALIIGGALGNLFDRLWHGFVVDMIDFYVGDWHFATFNLADSAICIGAALIVLEGFLPKPTVKEQA